MKNKTQKVTVVFLLIVFLQSTFAPTITFALTSGPHQPEYTGYEPLGTTDMVNLITGDFTYSLPILDVPSPEGGFALPLSYHAGIAPEEEASWVGLGWSLNAGAIDRSVSQYPDDFKNASLTTTIKNSGGSGYSINIFNLYTYDSEKGAGGSIGYENLFRIGWGTQSGFTAMGITFYDRYKNGVHVDPMGVSNSISTLSTITSLTSSSAEAAASAAAVGLGGLIVKGMTVLATAAASITDGNRTSYMGDWTIKQKNFYFKSSYRYFLDVTKTENMYGALYLNDAIKNETYKTPSDQPAHPYIGTGPGFPDENINNSIRSFYNGQVTGRSPVSDMHVYNASSKFNELAYSIEPSSIAYDNFNVMGAGVSGNIQPYVHEVTSLAFPAFGNYLYRRYEPLGNDLPSDKVHFRYAGDIANSYLWTQESSGLGASFSLGSSGDGYLKWRIDDAHLKGGTSGRREPNRTGLNNNHLASSRFVNWFTNNEIENGTATNTNFIDFLSSSDRANFRNNLQAGDGVGGFSITSSDGLTYHYALPVYTQDQKTSSISSDKKESSSTYMSKKYAYAWLLTAITGSDFVDRGGSGGTANGMIDNSDWGYWVKFDYGRFTNSYTWKEPYYGGNSTMLGTKECYYLNSIGTRTHTALFIKDVRNDGKGFYFKNVPGITDVNPASSMKLNEIVLLKNEDFDTLTDQSGSYMLKYDSGNNNTMLGGQANFNGSTYNKILDTYDINSTMLTFIRQNQIKSILFNYYTPGDAKELCKGTLNSFDSNTNPPDNFVLNYTSKKGKLTLKSVSIYGMNNTKLMPDFLFEYGNNPNYNKDNSDAWGMYTENGAGSKASTSKGAEWSLTKVVTPLGAEINIEYERDTYHSVSGNNILSPVSYNKDDNSINLSSGVGNTSNLYINQNIELKGELRSCGPGPCGCVQTCQDQFGYFRPGIICNNYNFSKKVTISNISGNTIYLNEDLATLLGLGQGTGVDFCKIKTIQSIGITNVSAENKYGGDIRVSKIAVKDENGIENITEYIYTQDGTKSGVSSGVCSKEPEGAGGMKYKFYELYDYPMTPVLYGKVTVLDKNNIYPNDYISKTEYNFITPDQNMITRTDVTSHESGFTKFCSDNSTPCMSRLKMCSMNLAINTSKIGSLISVKKYNTRNTLLNTTQYDYAGPGEFGNMGKYSQSSIMADRIDILDEATYYKFLRTTKTYYPFIPKSVTMTDEAGNISITNTEYDYYTGNVLETKYEHSNGSKYKTKIIPAHMISQYYSGSTQYDAMGSKIYNINNKNMLTQEAANFLYWIKPDNSEIKLVEQNIQTWNKDWNYWDYDATANNYIDVTESTDAKKVWRKHQSYSWKALVNADGTINNSTYTDFNWANPASLAAGWQKAGEVKRYDHYSHPVEGVDINNNYTASKIGHSASLGISLAANASYRSFTCTGFEDLVNVKTPADPIYYFGGEVYLNQGTQYAGNGTTILPHTGKYMAKIAQGQDGPIYKATTGTNGLQTGRTYRASVWVHNSSPNNTTLICSLDGANEGSNPFVTMQKTAGKQVGSWWLLTVDIVIPSNYTSSGGGSTNDLRVYVSNPSGSGYDAYADDMRIHPVNSPVVANVYDEKKGLLMATLDNENFATLFDYDDAGRIIRTWKETLNGIKKVSETEYHYR